MSLKKYVYDVTSMIMHCRYHLAKANVNVFQYPEKATIGRVFTIVKNNAYINIGPNINFDIPIKRIEYALINIKKIDEDVYKALLEQDTTQLMVENMLQKLINKKTYDELLTVEKVERIDTPHL